MYIQEMGFKSKTISPHWVSHFSNQSYALVHSPKLLLGTPVQFFINAMI